MKALAVAWTIAFWFLLNQLAFAATVTLTWDASPTSDVVGYRVKWGFERGGPYTHTVEAGSALTVTIVEPFPFDESVFFTAYAYNSLGLESGPSNEVEWRVPVPPTPTPAPTPSAPAPPSNLQIFIQSIVNWWWNLWKA